MAEEPMTIADYYDPDGDKLSANSDPLWAWLTYRDEVRGGVVRDCGFSLEDFREYVFSLKAK